MDADLVETAWQMALLGRRPEPGLLPHPDQTFLYTYGVGLAVTLGIMTLLWPVSLRLENARIVDIF